MNQNEIMSAQASALKLAAQSSTGLQKPRTDFSNMDFDKNLIEQLDHDTEVRNKYKTQAKRQKIELSKEEKAFDRKTSYLSEVVPSIATYNGTINILQMKEDDPGDETW